MAFETKHERKQKRRDKFTKEVKQKKFRLYGDINSKNDSYKRKNKHDFDIDGLDMNY